MRLPAPVQSPPLSPAPSERAPVHSSPVATSTTGLPPRAQSMRTSTTGLSQAIVPQPEDPAEARRQEEEASLYKHKARSYGRTVDGEPLPSPSP